MRVHSHTLSQRLAYTFKTAKGTPLVFDLSAFQPALDAIRRRCRELRQPADLAGLLKATKGGGSAATRGNKTAAACPPDRVERMALVAAAFERYLDITLFDGQILAGLVMAGGGLAELATGEGKTFAAALCAVERALEGGGCHVLTANDYLAERDAAWLRPVYQALGLSVAAIRSGMDPEARRLAYAADITYATAREVVYDYLRDGLAYSVRELRQRPLAAAIVDEADFLMIDQARTPMVIAGGAAGDSHTVRVCGCLAERLVPLEHYRLDRRNKRVALTLSGQQAVAAVLRLEGMHQLEDIEIYARVHAALYARCLLQRDVDYVVRAGRVELVDCFTGRVAEGRRWPYGVQAAVEAREAVAIQSESGILNSITLQRFFPLYPKLAAMTATALPAAEELAEVYGLSIYLIPPQRASRREDAPDRLFLTLAAKETALVEAVVAEHRRQRPVLLVTGSVKESEHLASLLAARGLACQVLNAKNDQQEAHAIARAGCRSMLTISTELAGRGTDIRLGGPEADPAELAFLSSLGGLCLLVSGRRESRRHDDQLRGRAGRQGEPGYSCFFTSLEDELFERYGIKEFLSPELRGQLEGAAVEGSAAGLAVEAAATASVAAAVGERPLHDKRAQAEMDRAQRLIETQLHRLRKARLRSSQLLELQRRRLLAWREELLHAEAVAARGPALAALDRFWQRHLALAEDLREGIHLAAYGGRDPEREFDRRLDEAYLAGLAELEKQVAALQDADSVGSEPVQQADWQAAGNSATWTYQIDEDPLPAFSLGAVAGSADIVQALVQLPLSLARGLFGRRRRVTGKA